MILALQYYEGDMYNAMKLARLLADIEKVPRKDVLLALICQPGTPFDNRVKRAICHCSKKFSVIHVVSKYGAKGWADGSGQLWTGTMEYFHDQWKRREVSFDSIFTFDGGDGVPLCIDWINRLKKEWARARLKGKLVMGTKITGKGKNRPKPGGFHDHINANMVLLLSIWDKYPSLHHIPLGASLKKHNTLDQYHADVLLSEALVSTVICSKWNHTGLTLDIMRDCARNSAWLHGYKDFCATDVAREFLFSMESREKVELQSLTVQGKNISYSAVTNPGCTDPADQAYGLGCPQDVIIG